LLPGFVGSDEFHLWRSAALMALNTFGAMLLVLLSLPAMLHWVAAAANSREVQGAAGQVEKQDHAGAAAHPAVAGSTQQALLVAGLVRAAAAFCATLSAAVQRRHLYAWALFAPKFAFEACFLLLTDVALLLLALLA
jgi:phosphatidylinositol glycan class O